MALTEQQLAQRRIGGSSSAAILGLSKYRSRYQEWLRCTNQDEPEDLSDNIHIFTGNLLEPVIVELLRERGFDVKTGFEQEIHPKFSYISRNVDALSENGTIVDEIKTAVSFMRKNFGEPGSSDIIPEYNAQINHYSIWPGVKKMRLHVLFIPLEMKKMLFETQPSEHPLSFEQLMSICRTLELVTFVCEPDYLLHDYMLDQYKEFWGYVERMEMPPAQDMNELTQQFMISQKSSVPANDAVLRADSRLREIKEEMKALKAEEEQMKFAICSVMNDAEELIYNGKKIRTWKTQETHRLDSKRLKEEEPEVWREYEKVTTSRVFR